MNHYGDVSKINGAEVEPYAIAVTKSRFETARAAIAEATDENPA